MEMLDSPIRAYAWGSRTVLAGLQGRPTPSPTPEAELWMGAHPAAPSTVTRSGVSLADLVAAEPEAVLGSEVVDRFGARLPYLLKLLAAAEPLSLQAHPTEEQARQGYAAERAAGASEVNYIDQHHKPELLVAVSEFEALCGFREPAVAADVLDGLAVSELAEVVGLLRAGDLREAVASLLRWPSEGRAELVDAVVRAAAAAAAVSEQAALPALSEQAASPASAAYALVGRLAKYYPGDVGVVVSMLLNYVTLDPGEAIWMPAGNLHAYLRGTGVEIMAASDNVLRGGLTPKHVDVTELLRVLRFTPLADPVMRAEPVAPGVVTWPTPAAEFRLHRVILDDTAAAVELALAGPRTVFCLDGAVTVDDGEAVTLRPGVAAFGAATHRPLRLSGPGVAFIAAPRLAAAGTAAGNAVSDE